MSEEMYKSMFQDAIRALAAIDTALGMPDDGCNSPERTITAIKLLHSAHRDDVAENDALAARLAEATALLERWYDGERPYFPTGLFLHPSGTTDSADEVQR